MGWLETPQQTTSKYTYLPTHPSSDLGGLVVDIRLLRRALTDPLLHSRIPSPGARTRLKGEPVLSRYRPFGRVPFLKNVVRLKSKKHDQAVSTLIDNLPDVSARTMSKLSLEELSDPH